LPVSFYLCFEHVDNLGAYTASRPETGLLIPSGYNSYQVDAGSLQSVILRSLLGSKSL
jgi:hypothetical protein